MGSVGKDDFSKTLEDKAEEAGVRVRYQKQDDHPTGKNSTPIHSFLCPPFPLPKAPQNFLSLHISGGAYEGTSVCTLKKPYKKAVIICPLKFPIKK